MNRNDIRPAVIGIAAGATTIAGLIAWSEFEPHRAVVDYLARRQLTADERSELDRIAAERIAEQAERASFYKEQDAAQAARCAEVLAGFVPELLTVASAVTSPDELGLDELVAEIVHVEAQYRSSNDWILDPRVSDHGAALREEWRRRNSGLLPYTRSRVEQLRYDLARELIGAATSAPYAPVALAIDETGGVVAARDVYPDFFGPTAVDYEARP